METNFLLQALQWLEMHPLGVTTGIIGSTLSLFVWNGNTFTWRRTFATLLGGIFLCGYTLPIAEVMAKKIFINPDEIRSSSLVINVFIGFLLSDFLSSIKSAAPTMTKAIVTGLAKWLDRILGTKTKKNE